MNEQDIEKIKAAGVHDALRRAFDGKLSHASNVISHATRQRDGFFVCADECLNEAKRLVGQAEALFAELRKVDPTHK